MNIISARDGTTLTVSLEGRLDTVSAPRLESVLRDAYEETELLVFDLGRLTHISSAGLRILLSARKAMEQRGRMVIRRVRPEVMKIFEVIGFVNILNIETGEEVE